VKSNTIVLLAFVLWLMPANSSADLHEVREVHFQMGTYLEITLWHSEPESAKRLIRDAVQEVHRLDAIFSNYDPDSALSRLNRHAGAGRVSIPIELYEVLAWSQKFSETTGGKFDITIGPLMVLWQNAAATKQMPSTEQLDQALSLVDYHNIKLYHPNAAALLRSGMMIDLGGIGKGYAVDRMTTMLKAANVTAALINFGGSSVSAVGAPPGKTGWEIAVQDTDGRLRGAIQLRDLALSTSGSMGRTWIISGKKYGHLIDPLTGIPVTKARMATVITPSSTLAEALTKPLILSESNGLGTVEKFPNTEAVVLPQFGAPVFSRHFRDLSFWKPIRGS